MRGRACTPDLAAQSTPHHPAEPRPMPTLLSMALLCVACAGKAATTVERPEGKGVRPFVDRGVS